MSDQTTHSQSTVEQLLLSLRNDYLSESPERCDDLESHIMEMTKPEQFDDAFAEIYREVHSMKGSAGTHGLMPLSTICHHFEDLLTMIDNKARPYDDETVDICMRYIDLLRDTSWTLQSGDFDQGALNKELDSIQKAIHPSQYKGLIADASRFNIRLCSDALKDLPVTLTTVDNGFDALQRLVNDEFHFFITSKELPGLNGIAVLSALRTSESRNANISTVLMTSNQDIQLPANNLANQVVKKDREMSGHMSETINELLKKL